MYLPCVVPDHTRPDYLATVDVDPASPSYSQVCSLLLLLLCCSVFCDATLCAGTCETVPASNFPHSLATVLLPQQLSVNELLASTRKQT